MNTVLEAPDLRDDFYCTVLAYCELRKSLAVALGNSVYLWDEIKGVRPIPKKYNRSRAHVTSITFSAFNLDHSVLATGRADGSVVLWSLENDGGSCSIHLPTPVSSVSFRPITTRRPSFRHSAFIVDTEVLLVRDEMGDLYVFFVEWPNQRDRFLFGWHGSVTLHAKITLHSQQICGIAWSMDGEQFATGGNDNLCYLFETSKILVAEARWPSHSVLVGSPSQSTSRLFVRERQPSGICLNLRHAKKHWKILAAVKAIAFCPWQRGLLATGGGSNDRRIHFYHTVSGACLATIDCSAQVTSLIWSKTRHEIAATFGFAQPDHPYRIAVFSWPDCRQVVAIPWGDSLRALYAIPYPGGPNKREGNSEGDLWCSRTTMEGCIVVAGSDGTLKFHEVWSGVKKTTGLQQGLLGGSDILESLHGIEKASREVIR